MRRLDGDTKCFQLQQELLWAVLNEKSWTHMGLDRTAGSYNSHLLICLSKLKRWVMTLTFFQRLTSTVPISSFS